MQFRFGIFASWPTTAIDLVRAEANGRPLIVCPVAVPVVVTRLFFRRTADAEAISRTRAVCAAERTETPRFRSPEPSGFCALKLIAGNP